MNEQNEFEKHIRQQLPDFYDDFSELGFKVVNDYVNKQAAEIKALRGFIKDLFTDDIGCDGHPFINDMLIKHKLIDKDGNPTDLLTGERK